MVNIFYSDTTSIDAYVRWEAMLCCVFDDLYRWKKFFIIFLQINNILQLELL